MAAMAGNASMAGGEAGGGSYGGAFIAAAGVFEAAGHLQRGRMARTIGAMRRREAERSAKQVIAVSQRHMLAQQKNAELLASRAVAVAAAGGGSTDDPTVSRIISDIEGEGAYRAALALYDGEEQARKIRFEGEMAEKSGDASYKAGRNAAVGSLISTGASMYAYG